MNQVFEKIYEDYKRANKSAKERMIKKYDFETEKEFLDYLGVTSPDPASTPSVANKRRRTPPALVTPPIMHNVHILDASLSMRDDKKIERALEGINSEIKELKTNPDVLYITNTLVHFSGTGDIQNACWKLKMSDATDNFSFAPRGWTALYEAIGVTLERLLAEHKDGEKVLIKIFTDGEENSSSRKWKTSSWPATPSEALKAVMKNCEDRGFVITFVGTEFDVNRVVKDLSIKKSNTLVHDNTAAGVTKSFKKSLGATVSYRAAATRGIDTQEHFFTD